MSQTSPVRARRSLLRVAVHALAVFLPLAGVSLFAQWYELTPNGSRNFGLIGVLTLAPAGLSCLAFPFGLIGLLYRDARPAAVRFLVVGLVAFVVTIPIAGMGQGIRMKALRALAERSQPLVEAIRAYEAAHGKPPESLADLMPDYLAEIPGTGLGAFPRYDYEVGGGDYLNGNPWALKVFTPELGVGFESFFYFPLQNYGEHPWGYLEPVGEWGYLHE